MNTNSDIVTDNETVIQLKMEKINKYISLIDDNKLVYKKKKLLVIYVKKLIIYNFCLRFNGLYVNGYRPIKHPLCYIRLHQWVCAFWSSTTHLWTEG